VAGKLPALARLRPLGDLDLHHVRVDEVLGRDPEAGRMHLLDGGSLRAAVGSGRKRPPVRRPRPVFDLPPIWFMASAEGLVRLFEIEPKDIAPVEKRLTIAAAGSTSSSGMALRPNSSAALMRNNPRTVRRVFSPSFTSRAYSW
jgi:hypothetical protein